MSCADPETFVWRAGYYWPSSYFACGLILPDSWRGESVLSSVIRLHTVIAIEISLYEHLLKCHALFQERLSREQAIIGAPAKRH